MKCSTCQHENREGARFCEECGTKLQLICPKCGGEITNPQARFCDQCGTRLGESVATPRLEDMHAQLQSLIPETLAQKYLTAEQEATGENRLITALFADISGFTPLSATKSSETMFQLVQDCFKELVSIVARYEGSISGFRGDGLLALFGAPILHENDAERAVLAAIDMRKTMQEKQLKVSIGVNTAMMTVGEIQTQLHREYTAYGTDVNLAKRLQEAAQPGQILVGMGTHRLTRRAFDFQVAPGLELKGIPQRITAYSMQQVKARPEKLRGIEGLRARMIGREREFADLKEAADNLISGKGGIVTVIGEAGIGKSRLASELRGYLGKRESEKTGKRENGKASSHVTVLEGRCVSIGQPISYWPFLDILRSYLNVGDADSESQVARKLRESIKELFPTGWEDILPFLGRSLSVRFGDELDRKLTYFTPEQIRHQTLMRFVDLFTAISHRRPLLLILEDLHWADDLSFDLISLLMDTLVANPLMLLCIYRPEREHRCWQLGDVASRKCLDRYTEITLRKLTSVQSRQLVESLLQIENLPESTKDMILMKSEGNPFFIEEVIRYLIERDLVYREDDRWVARREIGAIDVPDTIQSVLLSRVDRLEAETKYVLQCASVIGRLFRYRLLEHLSQHERDLEKHLSELEGQELIQEERTVPELEYAFKHALTQEATYQGILEQRLRQFHQRVADGIEGLYSDQLERFYEELAHHHQLAGNCEKAIEYLLKSGIKAAGQFLNQDALKYFHEAEELLKESTSEHRKEKAMLYEKRGEVLQFIGRWTDALKEYEKALQWRDDPHHRADIYRKMGWLRCEEIQDKVGAAKYIELGLKELPENDTSVQRVRLEYCMAVLESHRRHLEKALPHGQRVMKLAEEMGYQQELANMCISMDAIQSWLGNYSDEYCQKAIAVAEELGDLPTLAWVYHMAGHNRHNIRGRQDIRRAEQHNEQAITYLLHSLEISESIGDMQKQAMGLTWLGFTYNSLGQNHKALETWEQALDIATETKSTFPLIQAACGIMVIYGQQGQENMLRSTFSRIMQVLASLEIDEESQAWAVIMKSFANMSAAYQMFQVGYKALGKESEFPNIVMEDLKELLKDVNSRPQKAWYHIKLMDLCLEMEDMSSARSHAEDVVSIVDEMGRPDYMTKFYSAYLLLGDIPAADDLAYRLLKHYTNEVTNISDSIELAYGKFGHPGAFQELYKRFEQEKA